jgi:hypothetical protein
LVRFIGVAELCGGVGVLLPSLTRIKPSLAPIAASGLAVLLTLASIFHLTRDETLLAEMTAGIGATMVFIAWGRFKKAPIASRK